MLHVKEELCIAYFLDVLRIRPIEQFFFGEKKDIKLAKLVKAREIDVTITIFLTFRVVMLSDLKVRIVGVSFISLKLGLETDLLISSHPVCILT